MAKAKKLPSGNWRVQASKIIDGKQVRKSFTAADKRKAELMAAEWLTEAKEAADTDNITLHQAFERYIESKRRTLSPATVREYNTICRNSLTALMGLKLSQLTRENIQRAINEEATHLSPKTVRNIHGLLSAVLTMFRPDLILNTTLPQKKKTEMYIPDDNDIKVLLEAVKGTKMEVPILLAAFGPMRRGEICALTSNDIHGNVVTVNKAVSLGADKTWHTKSPKTFSSYRNIEYPDFVIKRLEGIQGKITDMSPSAITCKFTEILKSCNLPPFRFHDLRHYAVSTLHAINVPDKYIMARGGWQTNYTMNNVYNHALQSVKDETSRKITAHFTDIYEK